MDSSRIWTVFDKEARLVLGITEEPGEFSFARIPPDEIDPIDCPFASLQSYSSTVEPEILGLLAGSIDLDDFLGQLTLRGYKVVEGPPKTGRFARL